jgi:hypothetical protein
VSLVCVATLRALSLTTITPQDVDTFKTVSPQTPKPNPSATAAASHRRFVRFFTTLFAPSLNTFLNITFRKRALVQDNPEDYRNESKFGPVPGIEVGATWRTRQVFLDLLRLNSLTTDDTIREECAKARVHTSTTAGISGGKNGAYSIVMSGGYEDDDDKGDKM